ncbi:MAG: EF-P beta-lysylation protein EpmB [Chromatiales bacterium]|jgi:EF-P beta-lysylation protein EpmB
MIPFSHRRVQPKSWKQQYAECITEPAELLDMLQLPKSLLPAVQLASRLFPLRVTHDYLDCIEPGNPDDPLLHQILPVADETRVTEGYSSDPVGDAAATVSPGLIHKYRGRVLLITTPACAIHCRYCFRREFPYQASSAHTRHLPQALDYIRRHKDIHEVILSGGDPLSLANDQLQQLLIDIQAIAHVKTIRLHSRLPIVLPDRIDAGLLSLLGQLHKNVVLVVHCNHAREISDKVASALGRLKQAGITLLNQSVLLRQVNDDVATLQTLSHKLFAAGVLPYYLHQLDRVSGAQHFAVSDPEALALHQNLQQQVPGYLLPRLVREIAGTASKQNLG